MRIAFVHSRTAIAIVGWDECVIAVNDAFSALVGRPTAEVAGTPLVELWPPNAESLRRRCRSLLESGGTASWEELLRAGDSVIHAALHAVAVRDDVGQQAVSLTVRELDSWRCGVPANDPIVDLGLASELLDALHGRGMKMHYQPIVDLSSGEISGVEALMRWTRPGLGEIPPSVFVPLAERVGLSADLDRYALQQAGHDFPTIAAALGGSATVAVNISAQNLSEPLERAVFDMLGTTGMPGQNLVLEITESAVMHNPEIARGALEHLRRRHVTAALDDFGTGYSSLGQLVRLPVTRLKIDRLFVRNVTDDADALALASAIIEMARTLRLDVVAEGIERDEQLDVLRQLGCAAGQGFLWSPAVPVDELSSLASSLSRSALSCSARRRQRATGAHKHLQEVAAPHGLNVMIRLAREGASATTIAAALNAAGYRTPRGNRWHRATVERVLTDLRTHTALRPAAGAHDPPPKRDPRGVSGAA